MRFRIFEVAGAGELEPVPGVLLATVEAEDAVAALDRYSEAEGFAPYSSTEMAEEVSVWNEERTVASAPFTNLEVVAFAAGHEALGEEGR